MIEFNPSYIPPPPDDYVPPSLKDGYLPPPPDDYVPAPASAQSGKIQDGKVKRFFKKYAMGAAVVGGLGLAGLAASNLSDSKKEKSSETVSVLDGDKNRIEKLNVEHPLTKIWKEPNWVWNHKNKTGKYVGPEKEFAEVYQIIDNNGKAEWVTEPWYYLIWAVRKNGWQGDIIDGVRTMMDQKKERVRYEKFGGNPANPPKCPEAQHVPQCFTALGQGIFHPVDLRNAKEFVDIAKKLGVDLDRPKYNPQTGNERNHVEFTALGMKTFNLERVKKLALGEKNVVKAESKKVDDKKVADKKDESVFAEIQKVIDSYKQLSVDRVRVIQQVVAARAKLKDMKTGNDLDYLNSNPGKNSNTLLAIQDSQSGKIEYIKFHADGTENPKKYQVEVIQMASGDIGRVYRVRDLNKNKYSVLGVKTVIGISSVKKGEPEIRKEIIYTPYDEYDPVFNKPEIYAQGLKILNDIVDGGFDDLRRKGIKSSVFPGKLVADVIPRNWVLALALVEHMHLKDEKALYGSGLSKFEEKRNAVRASVDAPNAIRKVLAQIAINQDLAYDYEVSNAGARGLFQLMPGTYQSLIIKYPKVDLDSDYEGGAMNEKNAVLASMALLDSDLSILKNNYGQRILDLYAMPGKSKLGEILLASYNCGVTQVRYALNSNFNDISEYFKNVGDKNNETYRYIKKYWLALNLLQKKK